VTLNQLFRLREWRIATAFGMENPIADFERRRKIFEAGGEFRLFSGRPDRRKFAEA